MSKPYNVKGALESAFETRKRKSDAFLLASITENRLFAVRHGRVSVFNEDRPSKIIDALHSHRSATNQRPGSRRRVNLSPTLANADHGSLSF